VGGSLNTPTNFEPKVTDGLGYTIHFPTFGTPSALALALMDADVSEEENPFSVRVGVCYANYKPGTSHANAPFNVVRRHYYFAGNGGYHPGPGQPDYGGLPWRQCPADTTNCPTAGKPLTALNIGRDCASAQECTCRDAYPKYYSAFSTTKAARDTLTPATGLPAADTCVVSGAPQQGALTPWFGPQPRRP